MPVSNKAGSLRRLLIDTDCGTDDAVAILLAFQSKQWDVESIYAVHGNASVDNVVQNVRYISTLIAPGDNTKLYRGAAEPLLKYKQPKPWEGHGATGLGNVKFTEFDLKDALECEKKHAVNAMLDLVDKQPGVFDMIALGPLTNIALAVKLDPTFLGKLKSLWINGGQESVGNTTALTEFNFNSDPEAAKIVLDAKCSDKIRLVTYDCTRLSPVSWEEYGMLSKFLANKMTTFLKEANALVCKACKRASREWEIPNAIAMWCMMHENECEMVERKMVVEVGGDVARGALGIDYYGILIDEPGRLASKLVTKPPSVATLRRALNNIVGEKVFVKFS